MSSILVQYSLRLLIGSLNVTFCITMSSLDNLSRKCFIFVETSGNRERIVANVLYLLHQFR